MKLVCPICKNPLDLNVQLVDCQNCGAPVRSYARLSQHSAILFNRGLLAARRGDMTKARDCFAAVVNWCPNDIEARNALAMACFELKDWQLAHFNWEKIQQTLPADDLSARGLAILQDRRKSAENAKLHRNRTRKHKTRKKRRKKK